MTNTTHTAMSITNTSTGNDVRGIVRRWQCQNPLDVDFTGTYGQFS